MTTTIEKEMFDFLCEFTEKSECEGEEFLVEATSVEEAIHILLEDWDFAIGEFRVLSQLSVEEGEMLGLDTY